MKGSVGILEPTGLSEMNVQFGDETEKTVAFVA